MDQKTPIENLVIRALRPCRTDERYCSPVCPDDSQLAAYLDHSLDEIDLKNVEMHLCQCAECRLLIACSLESEAEPLYDRIFDAVTENEQGIDKQEVSDPIQLFEAKLAKLEKQLNLPDKPHSVLNRPCIMIVDDDPDYLEAIQRCLEKNYNIIVCASGPEAIKKMNPSVEMIILDIKMPGMTGIQVADQLLKRSYCTQIVFNTGYPGEFVKSQVDSKYCDIPIYCKDDASRLISKIRDCC